MLGPGLNRTRQYGCVIVCIRNTMAKNVIGIYLIKYFAFSKDGSKVFTASVDKTCKMWDLNSNQCAVVAQVCL